MEGTGGGWKSRTKATLKREENRKKKSEGVIEGEDRKWIIVRC